MISDLDPQVLDHLAHLARLRRKRWPSRLADPEATAEALADLMTMGMKPALGWWRAQLAPVVREGPVCPPRALEQPITYADIVMAAEELAGISARPSVALELLAEMTLVAELSADVLGTAFALYEELCDDFAGRGAPDRGGRPHPAPAS